MGGIGCRWGSGRSEEADQKKRPLLDSDEWRAIENGYESARRSKHLGTQVQQWGTAKWQNWRAESIEGQLSWLGAMCLFPRRRPARDSAEDLGGSREKRRYRDVATGKKNRFGYIRQKGTSEVDDQRESEASKLRQTVIGRRVEINADGDKVGNFGDLEICSSRREESQIRGMFHKSSAIECEAATASSAAARV